MAVWYTRDASTPVGWSAVTAWSAGASISAGALRRQTAPSVGSERVFVAIVGGTTHATTEPTWGTTKGAKTTDNTVTWQEVTGQPAVNGDITNTPASSTVRSTNPGLGRIIKNNAGTHLFICSTAGTCGAGEPSYNTAAVGNTTTDSSCTWTYIGTSFSSWAAPHARVENNYATSFSTGGDTIYVADDHSQTRAAQTSLSPASGAAMLYHLSIDHTASLPTIAMAAGATIATTGGNSILVNSLSGGASYFYGFVFSAGSGAVTNNVSFNSATSGTIILENCAIKKNGTSAGNSAVVGNSTAAVVIWNNTTIQAGATGDRINVAGGRFDWRNTGSAIAGATIPTALFSASLGGSSRITVDGVDLSAIASGSTLVPATTNPAFLTFINCKIASGVILAAAPTNPYSAVADFIWCDSAGTVYRQFRNRWHGTLTEETTIVRTGGATDGITPLAWKISTTANPTWVFPFESFPISIWNDVTGSSRTLTVYGIWGGGAVPNNDDIWIEVEYLGDSGSPLASLVKSTKANVLASNSALSSDGSTWGGSTTAFKMSVTFTAELEGYVRACVKAARASSTFYIDPRPVLS